MQLFVDNITNIDFCYLHPDHGLVGETWLAGIRLTGDLDEQGMVCDFGLVKATVRRFLDEQMDHQLLVPSKAAGIGCRVDKNDLHISWLLSGGGELRHQSPRQCVSILDADAITPATVAQWAEQCLRDLLPQKSIAGIAMSFTPETITGPYYHYSHGLKKHRGPCQRIAHGHRSKIDIKRNGQHAPELEKQWAARLNYRHIGTAADRIDSTPGTVTFAYGAEEGQFALTLPENRVYCISADSTVENIALHIAEQLKQQEPSAQFEVKAYEGLSKGAIVNR